MFGASYAAGCGVVGALGLYHITQPAAARSWPADTSRASVWLTIIGVFASAIYLPFTATLVRWEGWRATIRVEAASVLVVFLVATVLVDVRSVPERAKPLEGIRAAVAGAWRRPASRAHG